jgi:hypothetical protein
MGKWQPRASGSRRCANYRGKHTSQRYANDTAILRAGAAPADRDFIVETVIASSEPPPAKTIDPNTSRAAKTRAVPAIVHEWAVK